MKSKKRVLAVLLAIVVLNSIGLSVVLPLLPFLVGRYLPPHQVALGMGLLLSVFAAGTFVAAPVLGALSDRYGRKPILILSLMGSVAGYVLFGIGGSIWVLFLGRILDGLTAGNISTLFAYIADVTEPGERARWFGYIGAAMGIGKIGGPALGGLLGGVSLSLPFYLTAGLIFLSVIAVYFVLPESLPQDKRYVSIQSSELNPFRPFKEIMGVREIMLFLVPGILFYVALNVFQFNFTVFLKDMYNMGPVRIGSLLTLAGICEIISRTLVLPAMVRRWSDRVTALTGLALMASGLLLVFGCIYLHSLVLVCGAVVLIITGEGLFDPAYTGRLSGMVDESSQGKLHGVNQSIQSANNVIIPLAAAALYVYSPAMLYLTAVCLLALAFICYDKVVSSGKRIC